MVGSVDQFTFSHSSQLSSFKAHLYTTVMAYSSTKLADSGIVINCMFDNRLLTIGYNASRRRPIFVTCKQDYSVDSKAFRKRILYEKYQEDLYHVLIDFKKAFDRVWHAPLWTTMKKYNISTNLIRDIKNLYDKATSAVLLNSSIGDWFRTIVGVRQGCLLSLTLFNIFLEKIMTGALEDHEGTVSIGGRSNHQSPLC